MTEYCTDYHCAGDCGLAGHGYQHDGNDPSTCAHTWTCKLDGKHGSIEQWECTKCGVLDNRE